MIDKTQDPVDLEAAGLWLSHDNQDALTVEFGKRLIAEIRALRRPSPASPAPQGLDLEIVDQEKGWDGMPVRVRVSNGKKVEWYFCKYHPMAQSKPPAPEADTREALQAAADTLAKAIADVGPFDAVAAEDVQDALAKALESIPALAPVASPPAPAVNRYGVDTAYLRRELAALSESLDNRPAAEICRFLTRLVAVVAEPFEATPAPQGLEPGATSRAVAAIVKGAEKRLREYLSHGPSPEVNSENLSHLDVLFGAIAEAWNRRPSPASPEWPKGNAGESMEAIAKALEAAGNPMASEVMQVTYALHAGIDPASPAPQGPAGEYCLYTPTGWEQYPRKEWATACGLKVVHNTEAWDGVTNVPVSHGPSCMKCKRKPVDAAPAPRADTREAGREIAMDVCRSLDAFQRHYQANTHDKYPGNEYWGQRLFSIIESARAALSESEPGEKDQGGPRQEDGK